MAEECAAVYALLIEALPLALQAMQTGGVPLHTQRDFWGELATLDHYCDVLDCYAAKLDDGPCSIIDRAQEMSDLASALGARHIKED